MKSFFCALGVLIPFFAFAAAPATIITRPGVATPPIKYYFDLSSALSEGVNQGVKVTISASNAEKTAVRFDSVQLFDQSGATVGTNVASKTDALTGIPYGFTFSNFGVAPADLTNVAGVQITFMDLGGENPTGKVTVQSVAVSVTRDNGEACVIADPITIVLPPPPPPTILSIQRARHLVQPGTHGTGDSESSGGAASSQGPNSPNNVASNVSYGDRLWVMSQNASTNNSSGATIAAESHEVPLITHALEAVQYGFIIPAGATINGLVVEVGMYASAGSQIRDSLVSVVVNGTAVGDNKKRGPATYWDTSGGYTAVSYGSSSDTWGTSLTPVIVNNNNYFGFHFAGEFVSAGSASIDYISATVYYTPTVGSVYDTFGTLVRTLARRIVCHIAPSAACKNN